MEIVRARVALSNEGEVLALLGVEVRGPRGERVELRRAGATEKVWAAGTWLRTKGLFG